LQTKTPTGYADPRQLTNLDSTLEFARKTIAYTQPRHMGGKRRSQRINSEKIEALGHKIKETLYMLHQSMAAIKLEDATVVQSFEDYHSDSEDDVPETRDESDTDQSEYLSEDEDYDGCIKSFK